MVERKEMATNRIANTFAPANNLQYENPNKKKR